MDGRMKSAKHTKQQAKPAPKQQSKPAAKSKPGPNSLRNQVLGMMGPKTRALYK
jgi:hypothetical protein